MWPVNVCHHEYSKPCHDKIASQRHCWLSEASPPKPSHQLMVAKERDLIGVMTAAVVVASTIDVWKSHVDVIHHVLSSSLTGQPNCWLWPNYWCARVGGIKWDRAEEFVLGIDPKSLHAMVLMQTVYNAVVQHSRGFLKHVAISVTWKGKNKGGGVDWLFTNAVTMT